jgi:hypothetical protein
MFDYDSSGKFYNKIKQKGDQMSTKEIQTNLIKTMRKWQKIEDDSVVSTGKVISNTKNPIIRLIMQIIQRDSKMHYKIQDMIADSLEKKALSLDPEELGEIWSLVEKHIALEKKTIDMAEKSLAAIKGKKMVVQEYLLDYLRIDEEKHNKVLETLSTIKKGMYPYG